MKIKNTLLSLIAGASLLVGASSKAEIINVPIYGGYADVQGAIDQAVDGDTINIVRGDYSIAWTGGWTVDNKNLIFTSESVTIMQNQERLLTSTGTSTVNVKMDSVYGNYNQQTIVTEGQSSLNVADSQFFNGVNYVVKNASGNLNVQNTGFNGTEYETQSGLIINDATGNINITKNFFGWNMNPIVVNGNQQTSLQSKTQANSLEQTIEAPELNILNNTMSVCYNSGIVFNGTINSTGYVANNIISDTPDAIRTEGNAEGVYFTNNNYLENGTLNLAKTAQLNNTTSSNIGQNFTFNPNLLNAGYSPVVSSDSPVWGRGVYLNGLTTYMNPNQTYIGSSTENMPTTIPEGNTSGYIALGLASLLALHKWKPHRK